MVHGNKNLSILQATAASTNTFAGLGCSRAFALVGGVDFAFHLHEHLQQTLFGHAVLVAVFVLDTQLAPPLQRPRPYQRTCDAHRRRIRTTSTSSSVHTDADVRARRRGTGRLGDRCEQSSPCACASHTCISCCRG